MSAIYSHPEVAMGLALLGSILLIAGLFELMRLASDRGQKPPRR